nr:hypothetical protein CTI12_AA217490 [Tanacetum cinerariifolium]
MFMGNGTASKIERKWKVILKLTSEKDLVLSNVFHVPNITKNMISGPVVKENPKSDKIGSKPDKNGKRGEARKSMKQL